MTSGEFSEVRLEPGESQWFNVPRYLDEGMVYVRAGRLTLLFYHAATDSAIDLTVSEAVSQNYKRMEEADDLSSIARDYRFTAHPTLQLAYGDVVRFNRGEGLELLTTRAKENPFDYQSALTLAARKDMEISRHHYQATFLGSDGLNVTDLRSHNGTYVGMLSPQAQ